MTDQDDLEWTPKRGRGVLIAVLVLVLGGGAAAAVLVLGGGADSAPDPRRVLIDVRVVDASGADVPWWGGSDRARWITDTLGKTLADLGMDPIATNDTAAMEALGTVTGADPAALGAAVGATFVVSGRLQAIGDAAIPNSGKREFRITHTIDVVALPQAATARVLDDVHAFLYAARTEATALREATDYALTQATGGILRVMAAHASLAPLWKAKDLPRDQAKLQRTVEPLLKVGRRVARLMEPRAKAEAEGIRADADAGLPAERRLGPYLGADYLIGVASDGRVITKYEGRRARYDLEDRAVNVSRLNEALVATNPDTGEREPLLEVYNLFSYPGISADGTLLAFVLDHYGEAKTLSVMPATGGEVRHLQVGETYYSSPSPSPDASRISFWHSETNGGEDALEVIGADGGDNRVLAAAGSFESMSYPSWTPDSASLYVDAVFEGESWYSVYRYDVATGERTPVLGHAARGGEVDADRRVTVRAEGGTAADWLATSTFRRPQVSPDGTQLTLMEIAADDQRHIGVYTLADQRYRRLLPLQGYRRHGWSPTGTALALVADPIADDSTDTTDIGVFDVATGELRAAVRTSYDDGLAVFSHDAKRLYFHHGSSDPTNTRRWTNRVYSVDLSP